MLLRTFVEDSTLASVTVVTLGILLHPAVSGLGAYSLRFPIFDVRVWTAIVFLIGRRTGTDTLRGHHVPVAIRRVRRFLRPDLLG